MCCGSWIALRSVLWTEERPCRQLLAVTVSQDSLGGRLAPARGGFVAGSRARVRRGTPRDADGRGRVSTCCEAPAVEIRVWRECEA